MQVNSVNQYYGVVNFQGNSKVVLKKFEESAADISKRLVESDKSKSNKLEQTILNLLLKGFRLNEIAENLRVSLYKVCQISAKYDAHKIYMERRDAVVLNRLKQGIPRKRIIKEMDISRRTVQNVAEANNAFANKVKDRDALILEKIKSGMDGIEVAKEIGVSEATVMRAVQKFGLTIRDIKKSGKT